MLKYFFLLLIGCVFLLPANVNSQDKAKEDTLKYESPSITVTSTKAEKRKSPVPFSVITEAEIQNNQSNIDLPQLMQTMPSIYTYSENGNGIGYSNLRLRGFDQRRISVLINGVPQNDPEDHNLYFINITDISESLTEVEVQRGAGLANYGSAAIAGSINLTTSAFINKPGINISTGVGYQNFADRSDFRSNTNKFKLEYSSGLVDEKYAYYAKFSSIKSHGYRDQSWADFKTWFASVVRFDDNLKTQLNVFGTSQNDGLAYNGIPKEWVNDPNRRRQNLSYWEYDEDGRTFSFGVPRRNIEVESFTSPNYQLLNDWEINENLSLKSTLFYFEGAGYFDYSGAGWTDASSFGLDKKFDNPVNPENTMIRAYVGNKQGGWVPRLVWEHDGGTLTTGAELRIHRSTHWGKINYAENLPSGFDPEYRFYEHDGERDIMSFFVREQYNLTEKIMLNADVQFVRQAYRLNNDRFGGEYVEHLRTDGTRVLDGGDVFDINYYFLNPRLGANWNINENMNYFISGALTSREPRMNNLYNASSYFVGMRPLFAAVETENGEVAYDFNNPLVKPERMLNLESGYEYRDESFFIFGNLYLMNYSDELVKSGQLDIFGAPIDGNAESTVHYGIELESAIDVIKSEKYGLLNLYGNLTYSYNRIKKYEYRLSDGSMIDLSGNRIAGFPDLMSSFVLRYSHSNLNFNLSAVYVGDFMTDNFGDMLLTDERLKNELGGGYYTDNKVDAYLIFNTNINYRIKDIFGASALNIQLQVNNLLNTLYAASGSGREFFVGGERNAYLGFGLEL